MGEEWLSESSGILTSWLFWALCAALGLEEAGKIVNVHFSGQSSGLRDDLKGPMIIFPSQGGNAPDWIQKLPSEAQERNSDLTSLPGQVQPQAFDSTP